MIFIIEHCSLWYNIMTYDFIGYRGEHMEQNREQWTSKLGFILSAAGSAIGLGAIWKFPYMTGMSGGGAFLFIFLLFTIFIGLPMLLAAFIIGRGLQKAAISAYTFFVPGLDSHLIRIIGLITCFLLVF